MRTTLPRFLPAPKLSARRAVVVVLIGVACIALLTPNADAARPVTRHRPIAVLQANQSSNWSGYNQGVLEPGKTSFTQISATWKVPTATQHKRGEAEYSSSWVGIGGGCLDTACTTTDNTLIQAGSEQDVDKSGKAHYSLWWELIPQPSTTITTVSIKPGDTVSVDIHESAPGVWVITVKNVTTNKTFTTTTPYSSTHATAEWIEETPLIIGGTGTGFAAMPNLNKPKFSAALANGTNPKLVSAEEVQLVVNNKVLATPSKPTNGNSFSVCTYATTCAS
jgi:Peptidase A4 family